MTVNTKEHRDESNCVAILGYSVWANSYTRREREREREKEREREREKVSE